MAVIESWSVELLDRHGWLKGRFPRVHGGSLSWSIFRSVGGSGSINVDLDPDLDIDWINDRVRITHHAGDRETRFGVWMIAAPTREHTATVTRTTIELLDATETLNTPVGWWEVKARNHWTVTDFIVDILQRRSGWPWHTVAPDTRKLTTSLVWEPEDVWLKVLNELAATIGYGSLSADRDGTLRCEPYVDHARRPVVRAYGPDAGKMLPNWSDEMPLWEIPNVVRVAVEGTDDTQAFIGTGRNRDGSSPWSVQNVGREIVHTERAEVTDLAAADALARRILAERGSVLRRVQFRHPVDETWIDDMVTVDTGSEPPITGNIVERSVELGIGPVVTDTIRTSVTGAMPWLA